MDAPTRSLSLTGLEVVFLADSIQNRDIAEGLPDAAAYVPVAREALLLLGSAYRELVSPAGINSGPIEFQVSEEMAWLFRSKVRTGDLAIDGHTNVGIPVLLKLYDLLNAFNSEVAGLPPVSNEDEPAPSESTREFLRTLKEEHDVGTTAHRYPRPDTDT